MLLAGGQGSRLYALTKDVAKPSVPFGGKYRIIDFPLSNCANSGIDVVGVLTQYRPLQLNSYIGSGQAYDLDSSDGGVFILPPYQSGSPARPTLSTRISPSSRTTSPKTCSSSPETTSIKWITPTCSGSTWKTARTAP